ncbi:MAG: hypothetical protein LRY27_01225, partial [Chitinophagales bacterium]|nr:hypothetical protein [Chitinophagales bacterium]
DDVGISITKKDNSNQLFSMTIVYSPLQHTDPKKPYKGKIYVDNNEILQTDTKEQLSLKLPNYTINDYLGFCLISNREI